MLLFPYSGALKPCSLLITAQFTRHKKQFGSFDVSVILLGVIITVKHFSVSLSCMDTDHTDLFLWLPSTDSGVYPLLTKLFGGSSPSWKLLGGPGHLPVSTHSYQFQLLFGGSWGASVLGAQIAFLRMPLMTRILSPY